MQGVLGMKLLFLIVSIASFLNGVSLSMSSMMQFDSKPNAIYRLSQVAKEAGSSVDPILLEAVDTALVNYRKERERRSSLVNNSSLASCLIGVVGLFGLGIWSRKDQLAGLKKLPAK